MKPAESKLIYNYEYTRSRFVKTEIKAILESVQNGDLSVDDALLRMKTSPFEDIGFAKVDLQTILTKRKRSAVIFRISKFR